MLMNISTKFHACIRMCMIIVISRSTISGSRINRDTPTVLYALVRHFILC